MKGQSLIEVLVALGIISIVVTAVASIVSSSLNNAQFSQNQNTATKYAQEGVETVRGVRNASYAAFATFNGTYCVPKGATTLGPSTSGCTTPNADQFIRSIRIEQTPGCGANVSKVIATVTWRDGKCANNTYCHKAEHVTCLSRINPL